MRLVCCPSKFLQCHTQTYLMLCLISLMVPSGAELSICSEGCPSVWLSALKTISHPTPDSLGVQARDESILVALGPTTQVPTGACPWTFHRRECWKSKKMKH